VEFTSQLLIVMIVLAGMVAGVVSLKKAGWVTTALGKSAAGSRARELRVVERVVVSAQHTLVLVEVSNTRMLVCLSPAGSNVTILAGRQQNGAV
jgi:flagellar biogenesis protein FliO